MYLQAPFKTLKVTYYKKHTKTKTQQSKLIKHNRKQQLNNLLCATLKDIPEILQSWELFGDKYGWIEDVKT